MPTLSFLSRLYRGEETERISSSHRVKKIQFANYRIMKEHMPLILKLIFLLTYMLETGSGIISLKSLLLFIIILTPKFFPKTKRVDANENMILLCDIVIIDLILLLSAKETVFTSLLFSLIAPSALNLKAKTKIPSLVIAAIQILILSCSTYSNLVIVISENSPAQITFTIISGSVTMIFLNILIIFLEKSEPHAPGSERQKTFKKGIETEKQRTFILSFSHELRNLINNMLGNIQVSMNEEPSSNIKDYLKNAKICGDMLIYSINNILDTGKIDSGNLEINIAPLNIYSALVDIWGVCSALMKKRELNGFMYISKNLPQIIKSDPYRLAQIIFNLMSNAIKYTEFGNVRLLVEWISDSHAVSDKVFQPTPYDEDGLFEKKGKILGFSEEYFLAATETYKRGQFPYSKPAVAAQGILKITISDTGKGIEESELENSFQEVRSGSNPESPRQLKTGLGLFVTKQIVEKLSGEIRGYSSKGKGSSLVVCLETESLVEENDVVVRRSFANSFAEGKKKAFVIDDDNFFHNVMAKYLNKLDIEISDTAFNGDEAVMKYIEACKLGNQPDLITLDLEMPVCDGKEAARRIRKFEKEMNIKPCIIMISSANCDDSEINECLREDGDILAQEFLKKPVQLSELKRVVKKYFS